MYRLVLNLSRFQKQLILLAMDAAIVPLALYMALALDYGGGVYGLSFAWERLFALQPMVWLMMATSVGISTLLELPRIKLNAYEQQAILRTCIYAGLVALVGLIAPPGLVERPLSGPVLVVFGMILTIMAVTARLVLRSIVLRIYLRGQSRRRVLIYGAGQTGVQLASALATDEQFEPVAFVDDNPALHRLMVAGLPVFPPVRIGQLIREKNIDRVVLAMPSVSRPKQARLANDLERYGCEVRTLPSFAALMGSGPLQDRIQPVDPVEFLNRADVQYDMGSLVEFYGGKTVLISGAGGSIGSELCRQGLACGPKKLVLLEINELSLFQIERELKDLARSQTVEIVPVLGSVFDDTLVRRTLAEHKVQVVLHAAAYKHVRMVERNRLVGLRNNTLGTRVLAEASRDAGVEHFMLISTDKAVRPHNVMGASKRFAELVVQDLAARSQTTRFGIVRFGNVLGSSGSVVPLFEEQIARGGPVTLTHKDVTRYFMTISEATRLVLLSGSFADGGEVFVLDMGKPVPILHLARQMIEAAGYSVRDADNPGGDIEIIITGLDRGEKLHEELLIGSNPEPTRHPKILLAREERLSEIEVAAALKALRGAIESGDEEAAMAVLNRWVHGYSGGPKPAEQIGR